MTKTPVIQPQDKYVLRMPDGLRDRIKVAAERNGRSMNAEIVRVLEHEFPEPIDLETQLDQMRHLAGALRKVRGYEGAIAPVTEELIAIVQGIADGRVPGLPDDVVKSVQGSLEEWHQLRADANVKRALHMIDRHFESDQED